MTITPDATMTDNWRQALAKCVYDGTTPVLSKFVWGNGGHITDEPLIGTTTSGSNVITGITDFAKLKLTQQIKGTPVPDSTFVTQIDESGGAITISQNATADQVGASLTLTGPKKEDPSRISLFSPISGFSKIIEANEKQLNAGGFSTTFTGSIEDTELADETISEFGILDSNDELAYYFTFREVFKTIGEAYQLQITVKF